VKVPFNCVTKIKLFKKPLFGKEDKKRINVIDKNMLGIDTKEDSWIHWSKFEEEVFCELEAAKIIETDIYNKHAAKNDTFKDEKGFNEIEEKMVVKIKLKVLQNQKVFIPHYEGGIYMLDQDEKGLEKNIDPNNHNIEVGHDAKKGVIAREVSDYNLAED
jgi:hypothetical protein